MNAPLDVFAQLSVVAENGEEISVNAEKEVITVTLPNLWIGRSVLKQFSGREQRDEMLNNFHGGLKFTDLTMQFQVAHRVIALLGPRTHPSFLSRLLGFGPVELKIVPILLSLFKR